jgi:hypothetical protein
MDKMATANAKTDALLSQCLAHLRALPFVKRAALHAPQSRVLRALELVLDTPDGQYVLPCDVQRSHLGHEAGQAVLHFAEARSGLTVFAPAVGRALGDAFEQGGVNFVDTAGNCSLRLGDRYIARIQGRGGASRKPVGKALRAPAYRALLALMIQRDLVDAPSRAIAAAAGVSPQTAIDLRKYLVEQGYVLRARNHHVWAPGREGELMSLWLTGYSTTLAPSLAIGRFRAKETDPAELERRIEPILDGAGAWGYGGGAAAQRLTGYYRGERTTLYVTDATADLGTLLRFAKDEAGPISLARTPGRLALRSPQPKCVHPLVAYADLIAEGDDRARDAARELYEQFVAETRP